MLVMPGLVLDEPGHDEKAKAPEQALRSGENA
jgi:hypothetical protein